MQDASVHYDRVTDAWQAIMGDNLHFGYFESGEGDLERATKRLIDIMLEPCGLTRRSRVLDAGCGIGGPACYIHGKTGCEVIGISTSVRGIATAGEYALCKRCSGCVRFELADAQDNGLPDRSFDVVWVMESSHLMPDKHALFRESRRVLREGGTIVLCDIMLFGVMPFFRKVGHYLLNGSKYLRLLRTFGKAGLNSPGTYCNGLREAGFREITVRDITAETVRTLRCWRDNAKASGVVAPGRFSEKEAMEFMRACDILEDFFARGIFGYALISARL
ncbi:MAG: methyltransferase domain-containing protein [Spirochaetes bacterium]|nr:methyltransferase domain-containing protein [Spirochaetota bacterium]